VEIFTVDKKTKVQVLDLMKKGHDILQKSERDHLLKSAYFLREAMAKIKSA